MALAVVGGVLAPTTIDRLSYDFGLPGQPAYETNERILAEFDNGGVIDPLAVVASVPAPSSVDDEQVRSQFAAALDRLPEGWRVVSFLDAEDPEVAKSLTSPDRRTTVALVYPPVLPGAAAYETALPQLTSTMASTQVAGQPLQVTGVEALREGGGGSDRPIIVEIAFGAGGAMIVLALVFGSLLAIVPLLMAAAAISTTFLLILGLSATTDVSFIVQYLVGLIGLGVAIDYTLLIVMRWREERAAGADNGEAVATAMTTAGRAVMFSGVTVAVSLLALVVVPVPFLRSVGFGGLLIPLVSVAIAMTLLPVILATIGPRLEWPRRKRHHADSRLWRRIGGLVVKHRIVAALLATAVLAAMFAPALGLRLGSPELTAISAGADPAAKAYRTATDAGISAGIFRPVEILTADAAVLDTVGAVDGVAAVAAPEAPQWRRGNQQLAAVLLTNDPSTPAGRETVDRIRAAAPETTVGGSAAEDADSVTAIYGNVGWVLFLVVVVTVLLLARALRSVWLPIKALVQNVVSIGAAYGLTVLIWQQGFGAQALFGAEASGTITFWVPLAAFSFLFGLSMDYELFILSRIKEEHDAGLSTAEATVAGLSYTGRLVSSAALILFLAFVALSTVPVIDVKIFATTLALGIALDATIVRSVLTPALVAWFGDLNWWWPRRKDRPELAHKEETRGSNTP
ncbi:MMPL family transporter [Kribbella italica]|uniref:RND superfamily putative drug exporter n=1 Tax=Kribbella italica TaxID=1540520 RepID=A0A7W9J5A4_9ACTN|nr:RND superfamily putative drug exporter [Kribbella italica]